RMAWAPSRTRSPLRIFVRDGDAKDRVVARDPFELPERCGRFDRDVGSGAGRNLEVPPQDRRPLGRGHLDQLDVLTVAVPHDRVSAWCANVRTQLTCGPNMDTTYRSPAWSARTTGNAIL